LLRLLFHVVGEGGGVEGVLGGHGRAFNQNREPNFNAPRPPWPALSLVRLSPQ
jgi:hypothetical protein